MTIRKADREPAKDEGESIGLMEPMLLSESGGRRGPIADLALEVAQRSAGLKASLPVGVAGALADLVRSMNCYYSNLIEGHDTHPIDIERALKADYSQDPKKRDLQLEARAHIRAQKWIDDDGLDGRALTQAGLLEIHRRFYELLPDDLLWVENPDTGERIEVIPGALRTRDVAVGNHIAISPGAVPRFLTRFEQAYGKLGKVDSIIAAATAHHRLLWIHPFIDGNGRVVRLMSYAILREALNTGGIWSVARGLARSVKEYKSHLANCDQRRRNDLDGRGTLSEEALANFAAYFLKTCLDQIIFMESLVQPDALRGRMLVWVEEEVRANRLPAKSGAILEAILYRGELPKGDVERLLDVSERTARRVYTAMIERGVLTTEGTHAPLRLAFPAALAARWMPGLFPDKTD
jgi:Fic family protein